MVNLLFRVMVLAFHPLHSSSALIRLPEGPGTVEIEIRVFADDFPAGRDSIVAARYFSARFQILDQTGRVLPLAVRGSRPAGPVLIWMLSGPLPPGSVAGKVWHGVLAERFGDQVNLVQVRRAGRSAHLVFSPGDGPKPLP